MAQDDQKRRTSDVEPIARVALPKPEQGAYGSGGSYGVGGGFDDDEGRHSAPEGPDDDSSDGREARAARTNAQQDGEQHAGFEREVDPDAAPPRFRDSAHSPDEAALAAKKRRGSRI